MPLFVECVENLSPWVKFVTCCAACGVNTNPRPGFEVIKENKSYGKSFTD